MNSGGSSRSFVNWDNHPQVNNMKKLALALPLAFAVACGVTLSGQSSGAPHLRKQGTATQLMVDGRPFLIRGGELGNSSASNLDYLAPHWATFRSLHLNTILAPIYWDLLEPAEGKFDFSLVDGLIARARENDIRLVLLWFGSWKNSMSCYAPAWVKTDDKRFPRSADASGRSQEILSPFSTANRDTDARAFATLMKHLREIDGDKHTVVMIQVENEIGMIPSARDHSEQASKLFTSAVPGELMSQLTARGEALAPELRATWQAAGAKRTGHVARSVRRWCGGRRDFHGVALRALHAARGGGGKGGVSAADVRQRRADSSRVSARAVSERRSAAAPDRRVARRRAGD
jgi:hypothetical protein